MSERVPEGWAYNPLSLLADIDKDSLKTSTDPDYRFRYIDIASVSTGQVKLPSEYIKFSDAPSRARRKLQQGDVLMSTVRPNLKAFAYFNVSETDFVASTGFSVIRAKNGNDGRFIFNTILGDDISSQIDSLVVGSNYPAINSSDVKNLEVLTPTPTEQQKIAKILTSVDEVIEKTQAQIDKLKDLKTGMMQELLTQGVGVDGKPHTEFKDSPVGRIPKAWECLPLSKVAKLERGKFSHRPRNDPAFYNGLIPFLQTGDVPKESPHITAYSQTLNDNGLKVSKLFASGTLVITIAATIGEIGILTFDSCFPDSLVGISVDQKKALPMYVLYVMRHLKNELDLLAPQTAQKNINLDILNPFEIPVPPIEEQRHISQMLSSIDGRIDTLKLKLNKTNDTKKALMQDLLTGKVRVTID
ncbi:type I restriction-modification system restriction endonuclease DNA specificity subunit HsdS [Shewanella chilikensis]|nr:type I restriction-modification system restriction endonuclease DNA specificity subunit HsdS [Shewanella chilikensis]